MDAERRHPSSDDSDGRVRAGPRLAWERGRLARRRGGQIARGSTERMRADEALRTSELQFRSVVQLARDAIISADDRGTIISWNHGAQRMFGCTAEEMVGQHLTILMPERLRAAHQDGLDRATATGRLRHDSQPLELHALRKDGTEFPMELSLATWKLAGRRFYSGIIRDTTDRERAEEQRTELLARERAARAEVEAARRRLAFLAEASQEFTASLDYGITLQRVADLVVPTLAGACIVEVTMEDASFYQLAVSHVDAEKKQLLQELRRRFPLTMRELYPITSAVLATGQPHLSSERCDAPLLSVARDPEHIALLRALSVTSAIVVPLVARGQTLGVVSLFSTQPGRRFGPADLTLAQALASRAALAIDNARLYREAQEALGRERTLRAQAEQMAAERTAVLGQIADGVVIVDRDGRLTFANEVARHHYGILTLGIPIEDHARINHVSMRDGRPWAPDELPLVRAVAHGEAVIEVEMYSRPPGGQAIAALVSATPVLAEDGTRLGAVMILHDVSAQRALERQKDEFFANISHDLRTPLAAIMTSIGVVLANEPPDVSAPLHRMLVNIEHAADRMTELVENLLALTRLQAGRVHLQLERCDMRELVRRTIAAIEPLAQERGQRLELELPAEPVEARVDVQRLERAFLNLLSNAQKYGAAGGVIQVRLERRPGEVAVAVADDGPGIAAADQQHLFERYYRPAVESSRRNQGSGLGLPITRAMVEIHGGRVWVDSTPGAGATFWIVLPTAPPTVAQDGERFDENIDR